MKTILVLTDLSINSSYTAQYALKLAQNIEANLLLCNVYKDNHQPSSTTWRMDKAKGNSISDLGALVALLKEQLDKDVNKGAFRPGIEQCSYTGIVGETVNDVAEKHNICMGLLSMHSTKGISSIFAINHARRIIDGAAFPVLLIPYQVRFKEFKTIVFATVMNYSDINVLESISGLAKHSRSEIVVTRVVAEAEETLSTVKCFFSQIPLKINYPNIIYKVVKSASVIRGLLALTVLKDTDLLILVHRKADFFRRFFRNGVVQKLALLSGKPLLIFPCSQLMEILPVY